MIKSGLNSEAFSIASRPLDASAQLSMSWRDCNMEQMPLFEQFRGRPQQAVATREPPAREAPAHRCAFYSVGSLVIYIECCKGSRGPCKAERLARRFRRGATQLVPNSSGPFLKNKGPVWRTGPSESIRPKLVAGACNHPNCLVLPFRMELIRLVA